MSDAFQAIVIIGMFSIMLGAVLYWLGKAFLRWSRRRAAAHPIERRDLVRVTLGYVAGMLFLYGLAWMIGTVELTSRPLRAARGMLTLVLTLAPFLLMIDAFVRSETFRQGSGRQDADPD